MSECDDIPRCSVCGKTLIPDITNVCDSCGSLVCNDCILDGICVICHELFESEIDLLDEELGEM